MCTICYAAWLAEIRDQMMMRRGRGEKGKETQEQKVGSWLPEYRKLYSPGCVCDWSTGIG